MPSRRSAVRSRSAFACLLACASAAHACADHAFSLTNFGSIASGLTVADSADSALESELAASGDASSSIAAVTAWKINLTGATGTSSDATINALVNTTPADVQQVRFDSSYAYVQITDVPSHSVGPFPGNPAYPARIDRTLRISRSPTEAATKTSTGMGPLGVMVNGVYMFNAADARTYNNAGVWNQNANIVELSTFDTAAGHPAPIMGSTTTPQRGTYHYHQSPKALIEQLDPGNTGQHHSPLIGFAFDGFPIYGPYGYSDPDDPTSAIKRMTSGYKIRDDVAAGKRTTLVDGGATLSASQSAPNVSTTYPAGYYLQEFEWADGVGDLNQYNMRWTVTPEYPAGTWAYFATATTGGTGTYPYLIGPQYFGVVDSANLGNGSITVPATATTLVAGDADADGEVDFADLVALAQNYNRTGATDWAQGDFDRNGQVGFSDLVQLAQHYRTTSAALSEAGVTDSTFAADWALAQSLVPEPTLLAVLTAAVGLAHRRRRGT